MANPEDELSCNEPEIGQWLVSYELNNLTEKDADQFDHHLMQCPFCQLELDRMREISDNLFDRREEFAAQMRAEGVRLAPNPGRTSDKSHSLIQQLLQWLVRPRVLVPVAAAVAIALIVNFQISHNRSAKLSELAWQNPLPYTEILSRSPGDSVTAFSRAMKGYLAQDYAQVSEELRAIVTAEPQDGRSWLYLGVCEYMNGQYKQASAALQQTLQSGERLYADHANWYLANVYLKSGEPDSAVRILSQLAAGSGEWAERAKALRIDIEAHK